MIVTKFYSKRNTEENDSINIISTEECICQIFNFINEYSNGKIVNVNKITVQDYDGEYKGIEGAKLVTIGVDLDVTEEHIIIDVSEGKQ